MSRQTMDTVETLPGQPGQPGQLGQPGQPGQPGKKKVQVYSLISSLKTYPTLHLTPCSLNLFIRVPFQLHGEHTVLQPFRRIELIVHIAISVLPGIHFHLSQVKHLRVKCLAQGHNILAMPQDWEGRNMIFLWKSCTKRDSKPHGRQRHRQSATL